MAFRSRLNLQTILKSSPRHDVSRRLMTSATTLHVSSPSVYSTWRFNHFVTANHHHDNIMSSTTTTGRRSYHYQRQLLMAASETAPAIDDTDEKKEEGESPSGPRKLPTRHSRHHITSPRAPVDSLQDLTEEIVNSLPGTLFAYSPESLKLNKQEEYDNALSESYALQQKFEYILRGYNATFPNSRVQFTTQCAIDAGILNESEKVDSNTVGNSASECEERLERMVQILERMEEEGQAYVEMRSKFRSQLVNTNSSSASQDAESDKVDDNNDDAASYSSEEDAWRTSQLISHYGAPPGPSTLMYDLILDSIACTMPLLSSSSMKWLKKAHELRLRCEMRHELDVSAKMDKVNLDSIPSAMTYNAVIRTAANTNYTYSSNNDEELRDLAIGYAFVTYDAMSHHPIVPLNSATYRYMLQVVGKFMPVSPSRGNIAHALYVKSAVEDRVLDEGVMDALLNDVVVAGDTGGSGPSHGEDFGNWVEVGVKGKMKMDENGYGFPLKWSKQKKLKRYDNRSSIY